MDFYEVCGLMRRLCVPVPIPDLKLRADEFLYELRDLRGDVVEVSDFSPGELFGGEQ